MRRSSFIPDETYPPLIVDSYRVLSLSIGLERLQTVTGWNAQIAKHAGLIQEAKLSQRHVLDVRRQYAAPPTGPDQFRLGIGEA